MSIFHPQRKVYKCYSGIVAQCSYDSIYGQVCITLFHRTLFTRKNCRVVRNRIIRSLLTIIQRKLVLTNFSSFVTNKEGCLILSESWDPSRKANVWAYDSSEFVVTFMFTVEPYKTSYFRTPEIKWMFSRFENVRLEYYLNKYKEEII